MSYRNALEKLLPLAKRASQGMRFPFKELDEAISEAEQALAQEPSGEGPDRCPTCRKVYLKHDGFLWCPTCQTEEQDRKQFKTGYELGRREGQHARMTEVEALAEANRRWGDSASITLTGKGELFYYEVFKNFSDGFEGDSWEAAFKAADKERGGE